MKTLNNLMKALPFQEYSAVDCLLRHMPKSPELHSIFRIFFMLFMLNAKPPLKDLMNLAGNFVCLQWNAPLKVQSFRIYSHELTRDVKRIMNF